MIEYRCGAWGASAVKFYKLALAPMFETFVLRCVREKTKLVFAAEPRQVDFFFCDATAIMIPQEWGAFDYPFAIDPSWNHKCESVLKTLRQAGTHFYRA